MIMVTLITIWTYIKKYWSYAALVLAVVFGYFLFHKEQVDFSAELKKIQDAHDAEIKQIQDARAQEQKEHEANVKKLQDTLDAVQKQYDAAQKDLDDKKKQEIIDLIKQYGDDPSALAQKLSDATGLTVVLPT